MKESCSVEQLCVSDSKDVEVTNVRPCSVEVIERPCDSEANIGPDIIHTRLNYMRLDISNMLDSKNIWLYNYVCAVGCSKGGDTNFIAELFFLGPQISGVAAPGRSNTCC